MNLITDQWMPVIRQNGQADTIAPWQIAEADNPVVEINAPRPDFQGALYQLLIGLLQTCFAPEDEDKWL
jgi:CRISPR system Cascade subunit CasA